MILLHRKIFLHKNLNQSILRESRAVVAWGCRMGKYRREGLQKGMRSLLGVMDIFLIVK